MVQAETERPTIGIAATFAADPLAPFMDFWSERLGLFEARLAPYGQLFRSLLDPDSVLSRASGGIVACLRWRDLSAGAGDARARAVELAEALSATADGRPALIVLCPTGDETPDEIAAGSLIREAVSAGGRIKVAELADAFDGFGVSAPFDPAAQESAHMPYTDEAYGVLAAVAARWATGALRQASIKLVAIDCDNTLWNGVVGEDGVGGIAITPAHQALHRALSRQATAGRVLCLLSKNNEADVLQVFDTRQEMAIGADQFTIKRINWDAKSETIAAAAAELGIGLDAVLFLDDSAVECAEMRLRRPAVMTVRMPTEQMELDAFLRHFWPFDASAATREDRRRQAMYAEEARRSRERKAAVSLGAFVASLDLRTEIARASPADAPRLAQLTQRTNQFNANLLRLDEADILTGLERQDMRHYSVRVSDRFGDYGLVGLMRARPATDCLYTDMFMLSCRALGRGVEHAMMAALGEAAQALGLRDVAVDFRPGPRNAPVERFLRNVLDANGDSSSDGGDVLRGRASRLSGLTFDADRDAAAAAEEPAPRVRGGRAVAGAALGEIFETIARRCTSAAALVDGARGAVRPRPDVSTPLVAPARGLEADIAAIWEEVLRVAPIGAQDRFPELGGKSVHLVRIHSLLRVRLGIDVDLATLFRFAAIGSLAAHLSGGPQPGVDATRMARMRAARRREGRREAAAAGRRR